MDLWRSIKNPNDWKVTSETTRLIQHWRHHKFNDIRPFFCQVEAIETAIWLTEVASKSGKSEKGFLKHLVNANNDANPELMRLALKMATGTGKTTVMAMLIAWQTINAVRRPTSKKFTRGFLIVTPGITICDRLRVLLPNDPDNYYASRELVPSDMLSDLERAKIIITNYHAFKQRERMELSRGGRSLLQGRGEALNTLETEGRMIQRVMLDLMGIKNIMVFNDEEHHCYREKPGEDDVSTLKGDDKKEAKKNNEAARLWISGLETINRKLGISRVIDLSATPFFLSGSGYVEGTLFPWTMSDFSLMDAIECGIVKLPRVPAEGWDANTVTHVLGVRAFGTQLLCEQVIGRALRRQSYDLNEEGLFNVEYADILGIPFDFTAKPVIAPPQPPRETIHVKAVRSDRDALEIKFPRVQGYRVELPEERLTAEFNEDSVLELTPDIVGPSVTKNQGIIGEDVDLSLEHLKDMRRSTLLFHVTKRLLYTKWRDPDKDPELHLFGQLKRITRQWLDNCLICNGGTYPAQLMYQELADMAYERITAGITRSLIGERPVKAVLDPYNPTSSTMHANFNTSKKNRWQTDARRYHINWVILDSDWEAKFCRVAESYPKVKAYVKNHNLGLEVPYRYGSEMRRYLPDFIVLIDDGRDKPLNLIVEIKGYRREDAKEKNLRWKPTGSQG